MQTLDKIKNGIEERQEKLKILSKELKSKEDVLAYNKQEFSRLMILHAGKLKTPASVHTRKKSLTEIRLECEAIQDGINQLESEINQLQEQKSVFEIIEKEGLRFRQAKEACQESLDQINQSKLRDEVRHVIQSLRNLMASTQQMGSSYARLHRDLGEQFSLGKSLDGELQQIKEDEQEDRGSIASEIGAQMQSFTQFSDPITEQELIELRAVLDAVFQWKALVGGFRDPRECALGRRSLTVQEEKKTENVKYRPPVEQKVTMRPPAKTVTRVVFDPRKSNDFIGTQ